MDKSKNSPSVLQAMVHSAYSLVCWSVSAAIQCVEWMIGRRALSVATLLFALFLATSPWLRPPISHDLRSFHLPMGLWGESYSDPGEVVVKQRTWRSDSAAVPILVVLMGGLVVVAFQPKWLTYVAGLLTILGVVAVSACLFNHPILTDWMDSELDQRLRIGQIVRLHQEHARVTIQPPRVTNLSTDHAWFEPNGMLRGCVYSLYGPVFIGFTLLAVLISGTDRWSHRLVRGFGCLLIGLLLAGSVTSRRWVAEYHLHQAESAEYANRFAEARRAIDSLLKIAPEYDVRPVTWTLRGRLDAREGRTTVYSDYLRAKEYAEQGDLPHAYTLANSIHDRQADCLATNELFSEIHAMLAMERLQNKDQAAASRYWVDSHEAAPYRFDIQIGYALSLIISRKNEPAHVEDLLAMLLDNLGDTLLISDLAALAADAYFATGDFETARAYYRQAMNQVKLPDQVNSHAQERMIGL